MSNLFHPINRADQTEILTVFLPGWAFDNTILRLMHPVPQWACPEGFIDPDTFEADFLRFLETERSVKVRIVGWSMGGMLGLDFAAKYPEKVASLVLVSVRAGWYPEEVDRIRTGFSAAPDIFLRDFYRKCFLGDRENYRNFGNRLEPDSLLAAGRDRTVLLRGLDFLEKFVPPEPPAGVPVQLIHGKQDIIAPVEEMLVLPGADPVIMEHTGHMAFLAQACPLQVELRKRSIREKFSRAADSYDAYAVVQAEVAGRLAARLPAADGPGKPGTILELGCGTGNFTAHLATRFPAAAIIALDFSREMLAVARNKFNNENRIEFICADAEEFLQKIPDRSYDLVASNGSLQWFADHESSLKHMARILTPNGVFLCSIFGPDSLKKLGLGLKQLFGFTGDVTAHTFPGVDRLQTILNACFTEGIVEQELFEKRYQSVRDLLVHIRKTGTSGWQRHGAPALTRTRLEQLDQWFVETYGGCRITYQVHFIQAVK